MESINIAVAQFENHSADKAYNLSVIDQLCAKAKAKGAEVVSFHELCSTGYTFLRDLSEKEMLEQAELIPEGNTVQKLIKIAAQHDLHVLAGVLEKDSDNKLYNTYVCVNKTGLVCKFRKLHTFISKFLVPGKEYVTFDIKGWKCSILICYDNNVVENVRAVRLLGTEILFAPHVTMCTPSAMPGRGYVDKALWDNRVTDPVPLRMEFDGPKGRQWLMRWLPARAYDNGLYIAFTNPIGMDGDHLKNGNSLMLDPYGEILSEIKSFEDEITVATFTKDKLTKAGGYRYVQARRPELYKDILSQDHKSQTLTGWMK